MNTCDFSCIFCGFVEIWLFSYRRTLDPSSWETVEIKSDQLLSFGKCSRLKRKEKKFCCEILHNKLHNDTWQNKRCEYQDGRKISSVLITEDGNYFSVMYNCSKRFISLLANPGHAIHIFFLFVPFSFSLFSFHSHSFFPIYM